MCHVLSLVRSIPTTYNRTTKNNFSLEGSDSFALEGKTIGVIGTGQIEQKFIRILNGFGSNVMHLINTLIIKMLKNLTLNMLNLMKYKKISYYQSSLSCNTGNKQFNP